MKISLASAGDICFATCLRLRRRWNTGAASQKYWSAT